jgi:hypothetical protein
MHLSKGEVERFYGIWFPLLDFVNRYRKPVPSFPKEWRNASVSPEVVVPLRDALWEDDALRQVRVLTNSRNPALRLFFFSLGLLMQIVWVLARCLFTRRPGEGRPKLIPSLLRFDRFRKLLLRAVERFYPPPLAITVFVSPQSVIH